MHTKVEKGFRIHPLLVINSQGTPLGVLDAFNYTRPSKQKKVKYIAELHFNEESKVIILGNC
jgi:hypothetical protein